MSDGSFNTEYMKNIITVTGIRPDFIRMSEIFKKLDKDKSINHVLIHTGQHYDNLLSDIFFKDLKLREPDFNLKIGSTKGLHYDQQAKVGPKLIKLIKKNNFDPDLILFLGDSNSVLASVPLRKEGYCIGHIEAGMRSYDSRMFEEINRKVCDHVSNYHFVYHSNYKNNLVKEGIPTNGINVVGNTIVEPFKKVACNGETGKEYIILDIHRPENFNSENRMLNIVKTCNYIINEYNLPIKFLKFKRTYKKLKQYKIYLKNLETIDLLGYKDYIKLMKKSYFIISDSGTAQEEPAILKKPVLVPRDFTERPESIENNNSKLINMNVFNKKQIKKYVNWALSDPKMNNRWLGDGKTSTRILNKIKTL